MLRTSNIDFFFAPSSNGRSFSTQNQVSRGALLIYDFDRKEGEKTVVKTGLRFSHERTVGGYRYGAMV
jgi:hypothetical protein